MADETGSVKKDNTLRSVYEDTTYFIDNIISDYNIFPTILDKMVSGDATMELRKRFILRAIDETWVNIIEDTLPSLDHIIRNPSRFIEDKEELLPVELTRKVSVRTLQHLAQHTDLISSFDGENIVPKKLLNVFKEETLQTYENRFINTLINRLFGFVNRRYDIAKKSGQDEKTTSLEFKESFMHDDVRVRMNFRVEIAEPTDDEKDKVEENYSFTTDLWHRVERLNRIIMTYADSEFCHMMGTSYIRPPVMRTNAILKNKDLHQCYLLWQFIESYDSAGYSMLVQENLEDIDESYIKELYSTLAIQYMIFRYNIKNEFEADNTLKGGDISGELKPRIIDELGDISAREFDVKVPPADHSQKTPAQQRYSTLSPEDRLILESLDTALDADWIVRGKANAERIAARREEEARIKAEEEARAKAEEEARLKAEEEARLKAEAEAKAKAEAEAKAKAEAEAKAKAEEEARIRAEEEAKAKAEEEERAKAEAEAAAAAGNDGASETSEAAETDEKNVETDISGIAVVTVSETESEAGTGEGPEEGEGETEKETEEETVTGEAVGETEKPADNETQDETQGEGEGETGSSDNNDTETDGEAVVIPVISGENEGEQGGSKEASGETAETSGGTVTWTFEDVIGETGEDVSGEAGGIVSGKTEEEGSDETGGEDDEEADEAENEEVPKAPGEQKHSRKRKYRNRSRKRKK